MRSTDVSEHLVQPRLIAAVHARVAMRAISASFRPYLDQVYAAARAGHVQLDGENVFLYRPVEGQPHLLDVAFGVGARAPFAAVGDVTPTLLPAGRVATATHRGSYAGLRHAHDTVLAWCAATGQQRAGPSWEVYGHWHEDESQLTTDVFWLLEG